MSWGSCDYAGPEFYRESEVVARKDYACVECAAPILKGERHLSYCGKWDGYIDSGRQHLLCRDACVWIRDVLNGECIPFGALGEWWVENRTPDRWAGSQWAKTPSRARWLIGARMYAMVHRRERLAQEAA